METLSEKILRYAKEANMHYNAIVYYSGKDTEQMNAARSFFSRAVSDLYNLVYQNGGQSLINCDSKDLKEIGLAYMKNAYYYKASQQDWYVNSVSAENAYYCLTRYFKETGDNSSLPFLFLILEERKALLNDKFKEAWKELHQDIVHMPYGMMSLETDVELSACLRYYHIYVQHHILSKFYDFNSGNVLVKDNVLDFYYPNFTNFVDKFNEKYVHYDKDEYATDRLHIGENYFTEIYKLCEKVLIDF